MSDLLPARGEPGPLIVATPEDALALVRSLREQPDADDLHFSSLSFGDWTDISIHLDLGLHSEITPPFMEAFVEIQQEYYRLVAHVKYGIADIRRLTQEDLDLYQIKVRVSEGSSDIVGELKEAIEKVGLAAVGKLSGRQIAGLAGGFAILIAGGVGGKAYLDFKGQERAATFQHEEHMAAVQGEHEDMRGQMAMTREALDILRERGGSFARAADSAENSNAAILKAASQTPKSVLNGTHLTRQEAKDLRAKGRRSARIYVLEQEMRVIEINTSDQTATVVVVEDVDGGAQHRLAYGDRLMAAHDAEQLYRSLRERTPIWLRMDVKDLEGERRVVSIRRVVPPPADPGADAQIAAR